METGARNGVAGRTEKGRKRERKTGRENGRETGVKSGAEQRRNGAKSGAEQRGNGSEKRRGTEANGAKSGHDKTAGRSEKCYAGKCFRECSGAESGYFRQTESGNECGSRRNRAEMHDRNIGCAATV